MKIRTGFVSNSSSSSFLIYGIYLRENELPKDAESVIESMLPEGFDMINMPYDSGFYIGRSWATVADDETGLQFKESTLSTLKEIVDKCNIKTNVEGSITTYEEAWYDG